ncbi:MAG: dephospho-CoA kinase [Thermoanaerobaculia bacterium]|jgi:dephospho-CoA kinase|nr:dephospho-CoA kinase [Thermoanaerobaculia bacterium]
MILRAGLTGGIASGKSTVAGMFAALGCATIDADQIVTRLYQPGQAGHQALVHTYGSGILTADGAIDRRKLADLALATDEDAKKLNALIHPLVIEEQARLIAAEEQASAGDRIVIVEATLLIESGGRSRFDRIIVVDADPDTQLARAVARGMSGDDAARRIARQMPREARLQHADYVIDSSGTLDETEAETLRVHKALQQDLASKSATSVNDTSERHS